MNGPLADLDYIALSVFSAGAFITVWSAVMVSGFLPRAQGPVPARGLVGGVLVYSAIAVIIGVIGALVVIAGRLPWAVSIIAGGIAILAGPFLAQPLPENIRESRTALIAVLCLCGAVLLAMPYLV